MTRITPVRVVNPRRRWAFSVAWMLAGAVMGAVAQTIAAPDPVVTISPMIVKIGNHLCRGNEGIQRIDRHGRVANVYSFHCGDQATFHEITVNERK